ncbi:MAG: glycoside hydrolase family 5 protein [Oscillospiraceae bacterium]|nr:glycoside hydrolase family 5 protein [Oscillospiraceae bacterium]
MNKKIIKKLGAVFTAVLMLSSFAGCNKDDSSATQTEQVEAGIVHDEIRDIPSTELVKEIKIGWSLGNTLDSTADGITAETAWGNIKTTKEMITAVKDAGFNGIRVPVTWGTHMDAENNVDEEWMNRIQEVVDYAYSQDMFVILNIHHEDWHDPYYDSADASIAKLQALWTQIGTRFADYDERLIFEGMNEPRKRNTGLEWNGGDKEGHDVVNQMNAAFVETIRGLGGNNAKRHLMLPTYAASCTASAINDFVLPEGDDKLIVSIHAYLPYSFALGGDLDQRIFNSDEGYASEIVNLMASLNESFISKGIPVIIGETGARNKANEDERAEWATYYISKAKEIGIPCFIWDNGAFNGNGENFGLLERVNCTWKFPKIIDGFMKGLE